MRHAILLLPLLVGACAPEPTEAAWVRSFSAGWKNLNHRLAYLGLHPTHDAVQAAFIGGASTTAVTFEPACGDDGCTELPITDDGLLDVEVVRASSTSVLFATGTVTLDVDAEGGTGTAHLTLPRSGFGTPWAWIGGFTIDATPALPDGAASCYDPRYGWLPTRIRIDVGTPVVDGTSADVPVSATFASGISREAIRACLDAVAADAHAAITVDVVLATGNLGGTIHTIADAASWPEKGAEQSPDALGDTSIAFGDPGALLGWSSLDFRFHQDVDPGRGAYLRTLSVQADPTAGTASGFATNTSATQLSGFDFAFAGRLIELPADVTSTVTRYGADALAATLDDGGNAVPQMLAAKP